MDRVLLVDDAADVRLLQRMVLEHAGFEIDEAAGGVAALEALSHSPLPVVVVLDVQMPDMDGWVTLAAIRRHPRAADVPVVLCTVKSGPEDELRAWESGVDGYLVKPFPISQLVEEVEAVSARSGEERRVVRRVRMAEFASR